MAAPTNLTTNIPDVIATPDQLAVAEYFASSAFDQSRRSRRDPTDGKFKRPTRQPWTLDLESENRLSIGVAFYGIGAAWLVLSIFVPYGVWMLVGFNGQAFPLWISIVQITFAPIMACLTFASVTISMWYVMIVKRFALAAAVILPGLMMLIFGLSRMSVFHVRDAAQMTLMPMFAYCIASVVISLPVQMWSGLSLSHAREVQKLYPRLGILAIMQLTLIASLVFAVNGVVGDGHISQEMVVAAIIGLVSTVATAVYVVNRSTEDSHGWFLATLVTIVFAFVAMLLVSLYAYVRYDETIVMFNSDQQWIVVVIATTSGTSIYFGFLRLGFIWLRACGWKCVSSSQKEQHG